MFLIFSYEILCLVEEEVFVPMEEGKGKLFFACMALSEILSCQTLNWHIMLLDLQSSSCNPAKTIKVRELLLKTVHTYTDVAKMGDATAALVFEKSIQI